MTMRQTEPAAHVTAPPRHPKRVLPRDHSVPRQPTILVFDSGLGGLTVFREIVRLRPDARYVYVADDALFPYGRIPPERLAAHLVPLMGELIAAHAPDLVVIACHTASTLVLSVLRDAYTVPFVGTVPAIKPACAASQTRRVAVLGTEATVGREYTRALIRDYSAGCDVHLVGARHLATLAEAALRGEAVADGDISAEIAPCFVAADGRRTDVVVLACTHYPLLADRFSALAPWPVTWIDPAPAIARRVIDLVGPATATAPGPAYAVFTSGRPVPPGLRGALARFGLAETAPAD